jgi:hypothetical protein
MRDNSHIHEQAKITLAQHGQELLVSQEEPLVTYDVFDAEFFGLDGEILVIYAGGKPRLAYRRRRRDRWSPQIIPNTPDTPQ